MIYNPQLETFIQVGVSPMTPPQVFVELWPQIQKIIPVGLQYSVWSALCIGAVGKGEETVKGDAETERILILITLRFTNFIR